MRSYESKSQCHCSVKVKESISPFNSAFMPDTSDTLTFHEGYRDNSHILVKRVSK